jgi:hypothetical protein
MRGISIHIGLNSVDPARYNGWSGPLSGCINDARDMQTIARDLGYSSSIMTDSQATAANVVRAIGQAAQQLTAGDILLLTYSGHGGQVEDANGDEAEGLDETWVLWDRMLIDDELYALWSRFGSGVRVFVLSDSCHSGTVARLVMYEQMLTIEPVAKQYGHMRNRASPKFRLAPPEILNPVYEQNRDMYDTSQWIAGGDRADVSASIILISGCQDNQLSADGARNGLFTETLLRVWDNGRFTGNYAHFHSSITGQMPTTQTPNLYKVGPSNPAFDAQKPFTIGSTGTSGTSGAGTPARPTITIANEIPNESTPATFSVVIPLNRYFAVEVTTNPYYFNYGLYGSQRDDNNFFGSWSTPPFGSSAVYPADYTIPQAAWDRLRSAGGRLYYRVWCSDSPNSWVNAVSSTPDAQASSAPSFELRATGGGGAPEPTESEVPSIVGPDSINNTSTPPRFMVNPGPNRYYAVEVTTNPYYFMYNQYGSQRTNDNFYASWKVTPFPSSASYPASFDMPQDAWDRLRGTAARLYYRLWATDSPNVWTNAVSTTPDANALTAWSFAISREVPTEARETAALSVAAY